nr:tyrosine-type recombinase/integrase [Actinoallomurus rhizosphaericola]
MRFHQELQRQQRKAAGQAWRDHDRVFASTVGTERNANNVLRSFRAILQKTELNPDEWIPREMRHSFVSVLSDSGVPLEDISRLVGHNSTEVTETVYRKQIRPVLLAEAEAMDGIFTDDEPSHSVGHSLHSVVAPPKTAANTSPPTIGSTISAHPPPDGPAAGAHAEA